MTTMHLMHVFVFIQVALSFFCHTYVPDIIKARTIYAKMLRLCIDENYLKHVPCSYAHYTYKLQSYLGVGKDRLYLCRNAGTSFMMVSRPIANNIILHYSTMR